MTDVVTKLSNDLVPAAVAGIVGYFGSGALVDASTERPFPLVGYMPNEKLYFGIMTAVSRLFNTMTRESILPYISGDGLIVGLDLASPVVTGGYLVVFNGLNMSQMPSVALALRLLVLGGVSDFVAGYSESYL